MQGAYTAAYRMRKVRTIDERRMKETNGMKKMTEIRDASKSKNIKKPKKKQSIPRKILSVIWLILEGPLIVLAVLFAGACVFVFVKYGDDIKEYSAFADECVSNSTEDTFRMDETSAIYDADGNLLARLNSGSDSVYLSYEDIPKDAVNAFVAVEDRTFWTNKGVDLKGIIRVGWNYIVSSGDDVAGASTITQQLVRTTFLTREVSLERKAKEIMIATRLNQKYSKEEIMEFYVNSACFGNGIYGLQAAANAYFGCDADELTLSQTAYLCALPNRPTYYNPYENPERALDRRNKILKNMLEEDYITDAQYEEAIAETIEIASKDSSVAYNYEVTYAQDCAIRYLMELDDFDFVYYFESDEEYEEYKERYETEYDLKRTDLYTGGYTIYTSLETDNQEALQAILDENLEFNIEKNFETDVYDFQGAMTVIDNDTGKVIAVIGGRSQEYLSTTYALNRAYQSYRQPGSSIKPLIVYTPALMSGYYDKSTLVNINVEKAQEEGIDVDTLLGSTCSLRTAVINSYNGCAMWLFNQITPYYGLTFIKDMQFASITVDDYVLAASLGGLTNGVTTVEMASGYATIANGGVYREPTCITSMLDNKGNEIYEEADEKEIYEADACTTMIDIMEDVIFKGTAASMHWSSESDMPAAGKTGTTNDNKDGWFCGMTPYYTISVWVGYDTPRSTEELKGSSYPADIWKDAMLYLTQGLEVREFE